MENLEYTLLAFAWIVGISISIIGIVTFLYVGNEIYLNLKRIYLLMTFAKPRQDRWWAAMNDFKAYVERHYGRSPQTNQEYNSWVVEWKDWKEWKENNPKEWEQWEKNQE